MTDFSSTAYQSISLTCCQTAVTSRMTSDLGACAMASWGRARPLAVTMASVSIYLDVEWNADAKRDTQVGKRALGRQCGCDTLKETSYSK